MLSPERFRRAIEEAIEKYQAEPPSPENLAAIVELQRLLTELPAETWDT